MIVDVDGMMVVIMDDYGTLAVFVDDDGYDDACDNAHDGGDYNGCDD